MRSGFRRYLLSLALTWAPLFSPLLVGAAPDSDARPQVLTVGVVPQFDLRRIHAVWRPILDELEKRTGLEFALRGAATFSAFERDLAMNEFDLAYINPYEVVAVCEEQGYQPLVRDQQDLYGILVVARNSPIHSVHELKGQTVAFPAPNALGATLMVRAELFDRHGIEVIPRYVSSHSSVYLNVALEENVAGGGVQKTLQQQKDELQNALRILYKTRSVPAHPLVVHPRVPAPLQEKIRDALLAMWQDPASQALLSRVPYSELRPARIEEYHPLAEMGLERFR